MFLLLFSVVPGYFCSSGPMVLTGFFRPITFLCTSIRPSNAFDARWKLVLWGMWSLRINNVSMPVLGGQELRLPWGICSSVLLAYMRSSVSAIMEFVTPSGTPGSQAPRVSSGFRPFSGMVVSGSRRPLGTTVSVISALTKVSVGIGTLRSRETPGWLSLF